MCRKPQIVAPAQWRSSPLARKKEAPIEEIEKDLKSTVNGFDGFVWYQGLDVVLTEHAVSNCVWHGNHLKLSVDGESISELCDLLKESTFPMGGWTEIATMRNGNQRLCLAGDWLGAE